MGNVKPFEISEPTSEMVMGFLSILATSLSSYMAVSFGLFFYPNILHKQKKVKKVCHISHRGGAGESYENTMSAFSKYAFNFLRIPVY